MKRNELLNYKFYVQEKKKVRVILDTDAACEADDQYAIVHALLTPKFLIKGIIAEQYSGEKENKLSVKKSYAEIKKILKKMDIEDVPVYKGITRLKGADDKRSSKGVDFLIQEAMAEEESPLFVLCQGAITNVAAALNRCPEIAGRFTCIWIGGAAYPEGGWEFNLTNDVHAANVVFGSKLELWQVPMNCYTQMQVSYAELQKKVRPCGRIGRYLFDEMQKYGREAEWICGESWALGDSPAIGLAMNPGCGRYIERKAPSVNSEGHYKEEENNRNIRVYTKIDSRFILEDFFAKLSLQA